MLRKSSAPYQVRKAGIWLFCDPSDHSGIRIPMNIQSEDEVRNAATFILGALAVAKAENIKATWYKAGSKPSAAAADSEQTRARIGAHGPEGAQTEVKSEL